MIDLTKNTIRIRVVSPMFFDRFRMKKLGRGISMVYGRLQKSKKWEPQSFVFDKRLGWTKKSAQNWVLKKRYTNPVKITKPVLIYDKVEFIGATKGRSSNFAGKKFIHRFKHKPKMYGMPDGSILIK